MKQPLRMLAAFCAVTVAPGLLKAQVQMKVQPEHTQLVRYEAVNLFVSILNESPYPLTFGGENGARLSFFIERGLDTPADRINASPLIESVTIDAGRSRDILCDVSRWYDLGPVGNYGARAIVEWRGETYQSAQVRFDVVNGLPISNETRTMWSDTEFTREFNLCYLARGGSEHLFLSVDDRRAGINYGVFDLGRIVRLYPPVLRVGRDGSLSVLHQSGFGRYTLNTLRVSAEQVRFLDQNYIGEDGQPLVSGEVPETEGPAAEGATEAEEQDRSLFHWLFRKKPPDG